MLLLLDRNAQRLWSEQEVERVAARFDRRDAAIYLPRARGSKPPHRMWDDAEIIASLQDWSATKGRRYGVPG